MPKEKKTRFCWDYPVVKILDPLHFTDLTIAPYNIIMDLYKENKTLTLVNKEMKHLSHPLIYLHFKVFLSSHAQLCNEHTDNKIMDI